MSHWIDQLDDRTAVRILKTYASAHKHVRPMETAWRPELAEPIAEALTQAPRSADAPAAGGAPSDADLARHALRLVAQDPQEAEHLRAVATGPGQSKMTDPITSVAVGTLALIVLQTRVEFVRKDDGRWSLNIIKGSMKDNALVKLLGSILSYFRNTPAGS